MFRGLTGSSNASGRPILGATAIISPEYGARVGDPSPTLRSETSEPEFAETAEAYLTDPASAQPIWDLHSKTIEGGH